MTCSCRQTCQKPCHAAQLVIHPRYREAHPEVNHSPFGQWYLEPDQADPQFAIDDFGFTIETLSATNEPGLDQDDLEDLKWYDPVGDSSLEVGHGLVLHAANGRDLWFVNLSAPRLLRPIAGNFAVQAVCAPLLETAQAVEEPQRDLEGPSIPPDSTPLPASKQKPAIGGILLWKDEQNFLRLDKGTSGADEMSFSGYLENKAVVIGRGRLPSERTFLRLERLGKGVKALCSADGVNWFTVGQVVFSAQDPIEIGLHAIGDIDRTIYHGAFADGTAIRFESFQGWRGS